MTESKCPPIPQEYVTTNSDAAYLGQLFTLDEVKAALCQTGAFSKRYRDFPAHVVVYYVIALSLFMNLNSREVLRYIAENLYQITGVKVAKIIAKSAISKARAQLGYKPLEQLYRTCVSPIATSQTRGAWYKHWRLVSLDGSTLDITDENVHRKTFGVPTTSSDCSPFPQLRFVSLVENGTHILFGAHMAGYNICEKTLAQDVISYLKPDMLCLTDRGLFSYNLWKKAQSTGAALLWRARKDVQLPIDKMLVDGSYLSRLSTYYSRRKIESLPVRVVIYQVSNIPYKTQQDTFRLVTTILSPSLAPAHELAALYQQRWEIEGAFAELKTYLRGKKACLRSKTPELVKQEFYGLMLAHFALRNIIHKAAIKIQIDPRALSFTHALHTLRRKIICTHSIFPSWGKYYIQQKFN